MNTNKYSGDYMEELYPKRNILCIDLKSFFAACECIDRGLDMYKTPLVVADASRGQGAITLAVSPYLRSLGVKSRCRLYEIPKHIKYIAVKPRMNLYIKKSKEVTNVYLKYVSEKDLFNYSIDEVFIDLTNYLKLYKKTDYELANEILNEITNKTGLTATCGIGPNIFLAKVAMDIEAKHNKKNIAIWTYDDVKTKLWDICPPSLVWGIGSKTNEKLTQLNIKSIKDLANYNKNSLIKKLGSYGEELWYKANGIDLTKLSDLKADPKERSFSHSQVLFKDYYGHNIPIIIEEMVEVLTSRLRNEKMICGLVGFGLRYSKEEQGGFFHSQKLPVLTDDSKMIYEQCLLFLNRHYDNQPIRQVNMSLSKLHDKDHIQLNIFESSEELRKKDSKNKTIDNIRNKFGKNSLIKASNLLDDSTMIERNKKNKGHNTE